MTSPDSNETQPLLPGNQQRTEEQLPLLDPKLTNNDSTTSNKSVRQETLGYLYMIIAAILFSVHAFCIRLSESYLQVPFAVNLLSRGSIHLTFSCIYFIITTKPLSTLFHITLNKRQLSLLALRGCVGTVALLTFYFTMNLIPVGDAISVFFLVPIFTMLLSRIFLSEQIMGSDVFAILLSFIGATIIWYSEQQDTKSTISATMRMIGVGLIAFGAFLASIAYTIVRHLGMGINFMSSVFAFSSCCVIASIFIGGFSGFYDLLYDEKQRVALVPVLAAGFVSFMAQCFLTLGLQRARAGPAVLMNNIEVPVTFLLGYMFLGETPTVLTIIGSSCIVAAALSIGIKQLQKQNQT